MEVAKNITKIQAMSDTILELQKGIKQPKKSSDQKSKNINFIILSEKIINLRK